MSDRPAPPQDSTAGAVPDLIPEVYDELRRLARRYMRRERAGHSLQATALVHEAYLRLAGSARRPWRDRGHFCAIAARAMREILIERARARAAAKRGGSRVRVSLDEAAAAGGEISLDLILLDGALTRLAGFDPELARLVELRFFGGLTLEETAEALGVSLATVKRDWNLARGWLRKEVLGEAPGAP